MNKKIKRINVLLDGLRPKLDYVKKDTVGRCILALNVFKVYKCVMEIDDIIKLTIILYNRSELFNKDVSRFLRLITKNNKEFLYYEAIVNDLISETYHINASQCLLVNVRPIPSVTDIIKISYNFNKTISMDIEFIEQMVLNHSRYELKHPVGKHTPLVYKDYYSVKLHMLWDVSDNISLVDVRRIIHELQEVGEID